MVPLDDSTPSYQLGEQIKEHFLEPGAIPSDRIYDLNYGLLPPPEFLRADHYPAGVWSGQAYGIVVWMTHGWSEGASGIITSGDAANLDDTHPGATWQASCGTAEPEQANNLAYALLVNGGIATVGATRSSWYYVGEKNYVNSSTTGGMGFQYAKRLSQRLPCGDALWLLKQEMPLDLMNYYVFNLYGDPSVTVLPEKPAPAVSPTDLFLTLGVKGCGFLAEERIYEVENPSAEEITFAVSADAEWLSIDPETWRSVIERRVPPKTIEVNTKAFNLGYEWALEKALIP